MWVSLLDFGCECECLCRLVDLGMVIFKCHLGAHITSLNGVPVPAPHCGMIFFRWAGLIEFCVFNFGQFGYLISLNLVVNVIVLRVQEFG